MISNKVFIIAEAGVNHDGSLDTAKKLIDAAKVAGADAVKFQTFKADSSITYHADKANYQKETTNVSESQYEMIKRLELDVESHMILQKYCNQKKIMFLSSPFDMGSVELLSNLGLEIYKIPSGEIINLPFLEAIGKLNKQVILSTGMSTLSEIERAVDILVSKGTRRENITLLHANTEYPTPMQDVNLNAMLTIKEAFKLNVGYSDHTLGVEIPIAATALGASVIEKHFTLDKNAPGPDHKASLEPFEFKKMVDAIRNIELALGNGIKKPSPSEEPNKVIARKSIVAAKSIKIGDAFTSENLSVKRPGTGISPMEWNNIINKIATKNFDKDEMITL